MRGNGLVWKPSLMRVMELKSIGRFFGNFKPKLRLLTHGRIFFNRNKQNEYTTKDTLLNKMIWSNIDWDMEMN